MANTIIGTQVFTDTVTFLKIREQFVKTLTTGDATPTVLDLEVVISPVGATVVTNFDDGTPLQDLYILSNGNLTVNNTATIKTSTGANKVLAANRVYHFKYINSIWYEVTT